MVNRLFKLMGLNGKAVLPMVLGLGCDTMATLTTRILESRKERVIVTLLLALGVPCSAQLGVVLGMIRSLSLGATLVWAGTVLMTMFAVGWLAARILPGQCSDFILELPPIRRPQLSNLVVKTMARIEWYLKEAVPLFLLGTLLLFLADRLRVLGAVERFSASCAATTVLRVCTTWRAMGC
jgi:ferrous iron transport protein B